MREPLPLLSQLRSHLLCKILLKITAASYHKYVKMRRKEKMLGKSWITILSFKKKLPNLDIIYTKYPPSVVFIQRSICPDEDILQLVVQNCI